ncbi:MAG: hypothetical protein JW934_03775 [Anaerolineae bacterium]|nr:hypothetical protein [Anaerolineae bacterium]
MGKHRAFLSRAAENSFLRSSGIFAPSMPIQLTHPDGRVITQAERLEPDMVDPAALIDAVEAWNLSQVDPVEVAQNPTIVAFGLGDLMPFSQPFAKIPWLEAMLGCPLTMTEGHIWVERYEGDLEQLARRGINLAQNPWFDLYVEFLRQLEARLGDRYPVTANTLFRGPSDLAAALMGVQEACVGWIQQPALMARLMRVCTDANLVVIEAGRKLLASFAGGFMSGFGIWTPDPVVRAQADHSSLLSPRMYKAQVLPYDLEVIRACPSCIFHIHNNGLHVAPYLVEVAELDAVEVMVDPYPVGERKQYEIEMLRVIQQHKPLILDVNFPTVQEADWLLAQLVPRGLCFNARFAPETFCAAQDLPGSEFWVLERK